MKKYFAVAVIAALSFACGGDSPSGPSHIDANSNGIVTSSSVQDPVPTATPDPNQNQGPWNKHVSFDAQGNLTINVPGTEDYEGEYCYFVDGPHPQNRLWKGTTFVKAGHSKTFPVPELVVETVSACEVSVRIQADAGAGSFNCDNPSNRLADSGTSDLHAYAYFDVVKEGSGEWIPEEVPEVVEGEWSKCRTPRDEASLENLIAALDQQCQPEKCYGERTREITYNWFEGHSCSRERRLLKTTTETVSEKCEMQCPEPEAAFCYYSVSGHGGNSSSHQRTCEWKLGGDPLRLGEWVEGFDSDLASSDKKDNNHCRFTVPGIYSDLFGQFQLTPGQSDPRCNKY